MNPGGHAYSVPFATLVIIQKFFRAFGLIPVRRYFLLSAAVNSLLYISGFIKPKVYMQLLANSSLGDFIDDTFTHSSLV